MLPETRADQAKEMETLPRCCPRHDNWVILTRHIARGFTEVASEEIVSQVQRALQAVGLFELPPSDALEMAELVVRSQLSLLTGRVDDAARLDPQSHARRSRTHPGGPGSHRATN